MFRPLITMLAVALVAASCSGSDDTRATYYEEAARLTNRYETASGAIFDTYRVALQAATPETGETVFVEASQALFSGLTAELAPTLSGLSGLVPPDELASEHAAWLAAAQTLDAAISETNRGLAPLTDPDSVEVILSGTNFADLQAAYRASCQTLRQLGTETDAVIACEPAESS